MASLLESKEEEYAGTKPWEQALWFALHTGLALGTWIALMLAGYAVNPANVPQWAILGASLLVPLLVGLIMCKIWPNAIATAVWLVGLIWMMILGQWILDMPTGPNACFQCTATEKLSRTFFTWPGPSGLIDDDGPFVGTWPAAALVGYSIGAWIGMKGRRNKAPED